MSKISPYSFAGIAIPRNTTKTLNQEHSLGVVREAICWHTSLEWKKISNNKNRSRLYVFPRQLFCYLVKKHYPTITLTDIAHYLEQDHSTVIHSVRKIENFVAIKDELTLAHLERLNTYLNR